MAYRRIGTIKTVEEFRSHLQALALDIPLDDRPLSAAEGSPMVASYQVGRFRVGNRWTIQPMEGWDGTDDGRPTEPMLRRWRHFGQSGAKLIWGGEAVAVRHDGRANPNQLYFRPGNNETFRELRRTLAQAHEDRFGPGAADDLLVGLQLTHSGRFSRPNHKKVLESRIAYHDPFLDARCDLVKDHHRPVLDDDEVRGIIDHYIEAAKVAEWAGFGFVDIKHCHGYLGHEFLSAYRRPGPYGGDFEGRTRFCREIIEGVRAACPRLMIGVRLSAFDMSPFMPDPTVAGDGKLGPGIPETGDQDFEGFGFQQPGQLKLDLTEPIRFLKMLREELGVEIVNLTAGSPYYNPHIQRPAFYPPCDGYQPPEDPLIGCARQMLAVRQIKMQIPDLPIVGSAYTSFQDFLPNVAQAAVRAGWVDSVGLGRMALSYWDLPADNLEGRPLQSKRFCRTFSDCTTAPRNGLVSGCYPLDDYYKRSEHAKALKEAKVQLRVSLGA